jgi:hypothetical protein
MEIFVNTETDQITKYRVRINDKNIEFIDPVPGQPNTFINFDFGYSKTYFKDRNGTCNCRFEYIRFDNPKSEQHRGNFFLYAKLNWWQRKRIEWMLEKTWIQKNFAEYFKTIFAVCIGALLPHILSKEPVNTLPIQNPKTTIIHDTVFLQAKSDTSLVRLVKLPSQKPKPSKK